MNSSSKLVGRSKLGHVYVATFNIFGKVNGELFRAPIRKLPEYLEKIDAPQNIWFIQQEVYPEEWTWSTLRQCKKVVRAQLSFIEDLGVYYPIKDFTKQEVYQLDPGTVLNLEDLELPLRKYNSYKNIAGKKTQDLVAEITRLFRQYHEKDFDIIYGPFTPELAKRALY